MWVILQQCQRWATLQQNEPKKTLLVCFLHAFTSVIVKLTQSHISFICPVCPPSLLPYQPGLVGALGCLPRLPRPTAEQQLCQRIGAPPSA